MTLSVGCEFDYAGYRYVLAQPLGDGGQGRTFVARRTPHPGTLALPDNVVAKVPSNFVLSQPELLRRFIREARILGNVSHDNIVKIIGLHEFDDGTPVLLQELVHGALHLPEFIKQYPGCAASLYLQALYALRAMHPGTVHRDLSPANLLVDPFGRLRVIDFGLAFENPRLTAVLTKPWQVMGTVGCVAPEIHRDPSNVDGRADIFSLGRSFAGALLDQDPNHVMVHRLPQPWSRLLEKCCEPDPAARYQDADEAIFDALWAFGPSDIPMHDFGYHLAENERAGIDLPSAWPEFCVTYLLRQSTLLAEHIYVVGQLRSAYYSPEKASALLEKVARSQALEEVSARTAPWSVADAVADFCLTVYPFLDPAKKPFCFAMLCHTAVMLHRFHAMGVVRKIYGQEQDPSIRVALLAALDEEDPERVIHGHGVIPGREP